MTFRGCPTWGQDDYERNKNSLMFILNTPITADNILEISRNITFLSGTLEWDFVNYSLTKAKTYSAVLYDLILYRKLTFSSEVISTIENYKNIVRDVYKTILWDDYFLPFLTRPIKTREQSTRLLEIIAQTDLRVIVTIELTAYARHAKLKQYDFDDMVTLLINAQAFVDVIGHGTYTAICLSNSLDELITKKGFFRRLSFGKWSSRLIPLGGQLTGYIVRILQKHCYDAWRVAFESGVPTEPLFKNKKGAYRAQLNRDGFMIVITHFCGENSIPFVKEHPEYKNEIESQKSAIIEKLTMLKLKHGQLAANFTVDMSSGKPVVRLIDWDEARILD